MAVLFNITHDANNLNEYDSTVTDGGDLSTGTPGLASTTAKMEALIDDTTIIYGKKDFTQLTTRKWRLRFYADPNTFTLPWYNPITICVIRQSTNILTLVQLYYDGSYKIRAREQDDNWVLINTSYYAITDASHYIEVLIQHAASAVAEDGILTLWIDGVQKQSITDLDLYDRGQPDNALLGAPFGTPANTSGTLYLDELKANDDGSEIGPVVTRIPRYGFVNYQVPGVV